EADAGLAQPPGHHHLLAEARAVLVARLRVFLLRIEHFLRLRGDQVEGLLFEAVHAGHQPGAIARAVDVVELLQQVLSIVETIGGNGESHVLASTALDVERSIGSAEPGRAIAKDAAGANVRRKAGGWVVRAAEAGDDSADAGLVRRSPVIGGGEI